MNDAAPPPLETDELYTLVRTALRLSRRFRQSLDEPLEEALGLNTKELLVLSAILDGFDTPGTVAERHRLPAPTVTRIVTKLVAAGLVERRSDPGDLRRQRLHPTESGALTRARTRATAQDIVHSRFGQLPAGVVHAALEALTRLDEALDQPVVLAPTAEGRRAGVPL
ncbi:MarR family winged helix-turn-helix transcriptional regulator [Deinococcus hohokamensis]|uniref:MarR family winged helix-turn-helix transcriptional regulator n=1 Tax=Deinococcus hohokamensis TaxID=309883 RepID=A0ABV9I593_9DEIO